MLNHIKELEKRSNKERTEYIKNYLKTQSIGFEIQNFRQLLLRGQNVIITDFCQKDDENQLLLTAHTNKYFSSPGANDNASGVAVLLQIAENLKKQGIGKDSNIKIVLFDLEDGLAYTDGSTYYAKTTETSKIAFVLNLDMVGAGNEVVISPRIDDLYELDPYLNFLLKNLEEKHINYFSYDLPTLLIEDHISFMKRGVPAISLNLMPKEDVAYLKKMHGFSKFKQLMEFLTMRFKRKEHPMFTMKHRHNDWDTSEFIDEPSLKLCEEIVMEVIKFHISRETR